MRVTTSKFSAAILAVVTPVAFGGVARADAGELDDTFGGDGSVSVPFAYQVVPAGDDGVWVGSATYNVNQVTITRLKENGAPDRTFGVDGEIAWVYPGDGPYPNTSLSDIAALPDGGVQVSGEWCGDSGEGCTGRAKSFVARFDSTGAPDLDFADEGLLSARDDTFEVTSLGTDQSISACRLNDIQQHHVLVRRYLADGRPDTAFGSDGRRRVTFHGQSNYRRLLLCGTTPEGGTAVAVRDERGQLRVKKLTAGGAQDGSYGSDGDVLIPRGSIYAEAGVMSADGGTLFVGQRVPSAKKFPRVLKLTADGGTDASFGTDGIAVLRFDLLASARGAILAERSDGSVAVSGGYFHFDGDVGPEYTEPAYLALITPEGKVDTSFGDDGLVIGFAGEVPTDIGVDGTDRVVCAASSSKVVRFQA